MFVRAAPVHQLGRPRTPHIDMGGITLGNEKYFDENILYYDRYRPDYPAAVFDDILSYSGIRSGEFALEIGSGTGKATRPLLERGIRVEAVEPGQNLAAFLREKYAHYPSLSVVNARFEDYEPVERPSLIFSATSLHWIKPDTAFTKCKRILAEGGTLAAFWNTPEPSPDNPGLDGELQELYTVYMPDESKQSYDERCKAIQWEFNYYGYSDIFLKLYKSRRAFDADGYVGLLHTYSNHMALPQPVREEFFGKVHDLIGRYGIIEIEDTVDLHMGRK